MTVGDHTEIGYIDRLDDERINAIINFEGTYREVEKLALETMARTARPPLFCFELAMCMQRLRHKIAEERRKRGKAQ